MSSNLPSLQRNEEKAKFPLPNLIGRKVKIFDLCLSLGLEPHIQEYYNGLEGTVIRGRFDEDNAYSWEVEIGNESDIVVEVDQFALRGIPSSKFETTNPSAQAVMGFGTVWPNGIFILFNDIDFLPFVNEEPSRFLPKADTDGCFRYWGLFPSNPELRWTEPFLAAQVNRNSNVGKYGYGKFGTPEQQFVERLVKKRLTDIKNRRSQTAALKKKLYTIRLELDCVVPPVYRIFTVPGSFKIRDLIDKVFEPVIGWERNYHCSVLTDFRNGSEFGQKIPKGVDDIFRHLHGFDWIDDEKVTLSDIAEVCGQKFSWIYDLGVRWDHTVTILNIEDLPDVQDRRELVTCIEGGGACPPLDGLGLEDDHPFIMASLYPNQSPNVPLTSMKPRNSAVDMLFIIENGNSVYSRTIGPGGALSMSRHPKHKLKHAEAYEATEYARTGRPGGQVTASARKQNLRNKVKFNWIEFDISKANLRLRNAQTELNSSSERLGFIDLDQSSRVNFCQNCGNNSDRKMKPLLKCSRCRLVYYCNDQCQKLDWIEHKKNCKKSNN